MKKVLLVLAAAIILFISCNNPTMSTANELPVSSTELQYKVLGENNTEITDPNIIKILNTELYRLEESGNWEQASKIHEEHNTNVRAAHTHRYTGSGQYYYLDKGSYTYIYEIEYCYVSGCTEARLDYIGKIPK